VGSADLRECLMLQLESRGGKGGLAYTIVADHLKLVESRQTKNCANPAAAARARADRGGRDQASGSAAGLRYSGPGARQVEPDVYISKDGDDYLIQVNDDDIPQLR
jgi:RNA polymerase sigma-54 factor